MTATLILIVTVAAAARLTRLVVKDTITQPLRVWVAVKLREGSKITYLVHCGWCTGLWISAGVAAVAWWGGLDAHLGLAWWAGWPLVAAATGWAVGVLQALDREPTTPTASN